MPARRTHLEVSEKFKDAGYRLLEHSYRNNKQMLRYECDKHPGIEQRLRFNDLAMGHGCWYCNEERKIIRLRKMADSQRLSYEEVKKAFEDRGYVLLETTYETAHTPMRYMCPKHPDKSLKIRYKDLSSNSGCRYCAFDERRLSIDDVKRIFTEKGYELIDTTYVNSTTPIRYKCLKHADFELKITVGDLKGGHGCKYCALESSKGPLSVHYNHELPIEVRNNDRRYDAEIGAWRRTVLERDNYTCQACSTKKNGSGSLNTHHLDGFKWCVQRRYDVSNGVTLCKECHLEFHHVYGAKDNTEAQFREWLKRLPEVGA